MFDFMAYRADTVGIGGDTIPNEGDTGDVLGLHSGDGGAQLRLLDGDIKDEKVSLDSYNHASNHTVDKNITVLNFY